MPLSPLLQKLRQEANRFVKVELLRLGQEVRFINDIDSSLDFMVGSMVESIMTSIEPAIIQNTNLPEDSAVIRGLVTNALYKAIDNKNITGISDMVNRRPGEMFSQITGDSSLGNLINSISNRTSARIPTSLNSFGRGSFGQADDVTEDLYDSINRLYTKVFNLIGMVISQNPSMIGHFATRSLGVFSDRGSAVNAAMDRFSAIAQVIANNCSAIDSSYYTVDHFQKARLSQQYLEDADGTLVNVRSRLIYYGALDEYRYGLARDDVQNAADALVDNGNPVNRIQEIMGGLEEMDHLSVLIENDYYDLDRHFSNLQNYMGEFEGNYDSKGSILGIITNIQAEIRSIINSMETAINRGQVSIMHEYERRWWMQLIALVDKMTLTPGSLSNYFSTDPDGYISGYNTNVGTPLQSITFSGVDLLRSQLGQLKYWVRKKLAADIPVTQIVDIVSQMVSDNLARKSEIDSAISITNAFSAPASDLATRVTALLDDTGMDRAYDLFTEGSWESFFSVQAQTATYLGQLESVMSDTIEAAEGLSNVTIDGLAAMNDALMFVRDKKRSRDELAATFTVYKELGLSFKVNKEIPDVQSVVALIDRFTTEASSV